MNKFCLGVHIGIFDPTFYESRLAPLASSAQTRSLRGSKKYTFFQLQTYEPDLWTHLVANEVQPLRLVFRWMMRGFSGHLIPEQVSIFQCCQLNLITKYMA